jgi:hypothetical protein
LVVHLRYLAEDVWRGLNVVGKVLREGKKG